MEGKPRGEHLEPRERKGAGGVLTWAEIEGGQVAPRSCRVAPLRVVLSREIKAVVAWRVAGPGGAMRQLEFSAHPA